MLDKLKVSIWADGADIDEMIDLCKLPYIKGFTTNPTLMRKHGVSNYEAFARKVTRAIPDKPISFEVLADDMQEMYRQAKIIHQWGKNIFVKIPVSDTISRSTGKLCAQLAREGVPLNVTAIMTWQQTFEIFTALAGVTTPVVVSVFAGRIADTGKNPIPIMKKCYRILRPRSNFRLLWASPREVFNIIQADEINCHIITVTKPILDKIPMLGKNLGDLSLETVRMFYKDGVQANFKL